jgi:tetratricopeptide (TPR) repeat protein
VILLYILLAFVTLAWIAALFAGTVRGRFGVRAERRSNPIGYWIYMLISLVVLGAAWQKLILYSIPEEHAMSWVRTGIKYYDKGDYRGAIDFFNKAIDEDSTLAEAYYERGMAEEKAGSGLPISDYSKAIELDPKLEKAYYRRGVKRSEIGNIDGAAADLTSAIGLDSADYRAWYRRGMERLHASEFAAAEGDFTEALRLKPTLSPAYDGRAFARLRMNNYQGALRDLDQALQAEPDNATAWSNRAVAKFALGDSSGALADRRHAAELGDSASRRQLDVTTPK